MWNNNNNNNNNMYVYMYIYYLILSWTIYILYLERVANWSCSHNQTPSALAGHGLEDLLAIFDDPGSQKFRHHTETWGDSMAILGWSVDDTQLNVDFRTLTQLTQFWGPLFVCRSKCWSNPRVGQCSEWHRRRLCRFSSASARSCSCRTYSPGGIAGREDVVFCDLPSKKTYNTI